MAELSDAYVGSSCLVTGKKNETFLHGIIKKVGATFLDIGASHTRLPVMPYGYLVRLEIHNIYVGLRVLVGSVYLSSPKMMRITIIQDVTETERERCFQMKVDDDGIIYNCMRGNEMLGMDDGRNGYNGMSVKVMTVGISELKFRTRIPLVRGDWLNIMIPAIEGVVLFCCTVKSEVELASREHAFTCKFMELDEEQEENLYKYLLKYVKKQRQRQQMRQQMRRLR